MIGLSVCHALASYVERRRLLIVFFILTALACALIPATSELYSKLIGLLILKYFFVSFSKYFFCFTW